MVMKIDLMRSYSYRVARLYDRGRRLMKEASMVKLFCAETLQEILSQGIQIHRGYGYMVEYPMQRDWRDRDSPLGDCPGAQISSLVIRRYFR